MHRFRSFEVIQAGFGRATNDIDLLIDTSPDNQDRVRRALMALPDQAIRDMAADDLEKHAVVRVADEIVVDLMGSACGIAYAEARSRVVPVEIVETFGATADVSPRRAPATAPLSPRAA